MSGRRSRLDLEHDAAAAHDLVAEVDYPAGPGKRSHSTTCACSWVSGDCSSIAEARQEHESHRDHELGQQPAGSRR